MLGSATRRRRDADEDEAGPTSKSGVKDPVQDEIDNGDITDGQQRFRDDVCALVQRVQTAEDQPRDAPRRGGTCWDAHFSPYPTVMMAVKS